MRIRARIAIAACRLAGMEAHYPPAPEPDRERVPTKVRDGSPCTGWPVEPRRYVRPR
jgi:hypothetical protein